MRWLNKWFSFSWKKLALVAALVPVMWVVYPFEFERVDAFIRDSLQFLNDNSKVEKSLVTIDINDKNEVFPRPLTFESIKPVFEKILQNNPKYLIVAMSPKELYFEENKPNSAKKKLFDYLKQKPNVYLYSLSTNMPDDMNADPLMRTFPRMFWLNLITDKQFGPRDYKRRKAIVWFDKEGEPFEFQNLRDLGFNVKDPTYFKYAWNFWGSKQAYIKTFKVGTFGSYDADWMLRQKNEDLDFENKVVILGSNDEYSFITSTPIFNLTGKIDTKGFKAYSASNSIANSINMYVTGDYLKLLQDFNDLAILFFILLILVFLNIDIKIKIYIFASIIPLTLVFITILYVTSSFYINTSRSITLLFFLQYAGIPFVVLSIFKDQETKKLKEVNDVRIDALLTVSEKVAHDIRSPLSAINLVAERATFPDSEYKEIFDAAVKRIDETATKILTQYRTKTGTTNEPLENISLIDILSEITKEKKILNTKISFEIVDTAESTSAIGLRLDMERILSNIFDNSIFALKNIINPKIFIALEDSGNFITVKISDNGTGIPQQVLRLLGNERVTTKADTNQGSGIGLLHAKRVIERLNGKFEIASQENVGTTITISLPKA